MHEPPQVVCLVKGANEPAFAADNQGAIIAWNAGAEQLLGWSEREVQGAACGKVLRGRDVFGNCFCCEYCPLFNMARRHEAIRHFELEVQDASGNPQYVSISALVVHGSPAEEYAILHILEPAAAPLQRCALPHMAGVAAGASGNATLSQREAQVLRFVELGSNTAEIAGRLCISEKTVRNHIQNILGKLGAHNRLEAVSVARRNNCP